MDSGNPDLLYVDASRVRTAGGELAQVDLRGSDARTIGTLDGVLIDPVEQRLRFLVVHAAGWLTSRRYLLPADKSAQVGPGGHTLTVDVDRNDLARCDVFDRVSARPYSDDGLLATMFRERLA